MRVLLITSFSLLAFYCQRLWKSGPLAKLFFVTAVAGLIFSIGPSFSNSIAKLLGIGRGVDAGLYLYVPLSLLSIAHLYTASRKSAAREAQIVRALALLRAELSEPPSRDDLVR